uniref:Uncharacterized protein n=1 Tax=Melopsittacus undulatus TaxID=13146 RepID=A0A8V5H6I2_MELUD
MAEAVEGVPHGGDAVLPCPPEEQELTRRLRSLYPAVNQEETPLPRSWSPKDKYNYIGLSQGNLRVHYKGAGLGRRRRFRLPPVPGAGRPRAALARPAPRSALRPSAGLVARGKGRLGWGVVWGAGYAKLRPRGGLLARDAMCFSELGQWKRLGTKGSYPRGVCCPLEPFSISPVRARAP